MVCHEDPQGFSFPKQPVFPTATFSCALGGGMCYFIVCFLSWHSGQDILEIGRAKRVGHIRVGKQGPYGVLFESHCDSLPCEVFFLYFTPERVGCKV